MAAFEKKMVQFKCRGMNLNMPLDQIPPEEFGYLRNVRSYVDGRIDSRPGLQKVSDQFIVASQLDTVHSEYTLNDSNPDTSGGGKRFIGYNTTLWWSPISFPAVAAQIDSGFSGNPLSMVAFSPEQNPAPFMYVYDSLKQRKYSASYLSGGFPTQYDIGIPLFGIYQAGPPVPTVHAGPPNVTGTGYQWRWQLRHPITGAKSVPGPPTYTPIDLTAEYATFLDPNIALGGTLAVDQQFYWDLYRFGGTLGVWTYVGTVQNRTGGTVTDGNEDVDIASNPTLDVSPEGILYQPWLTPDIQRAGNTVSTTAAVDTDTTGLTGGHGSLITSSGFNINWIPGTELIVGGFIVHVAQMVSANNLYVQEDLKGNLGVVPWTESGALQSGTPLPYVWGPYGSGSTGLYVFGCGDPHAVGTLYWTFGNDPDSMSITGSLELTDTSEPLQNGCVWNGRVWVWSSERLWEIVPNLTTANQFVAQVVPGAKGLPYNWCFAVGDLIYWLSKDGVYRFGGGGLPESLSDHQLNILLGHDGNQGVNVTLPNPDAIGTELTISAPDPNHPAQLRMNWHQGVLHFDYADVNLHPVSLVYDSHIVKGWLLDEYVPSGFVVHFSETGFNDLLIGIGNVLFLSTGNSDNGSTIPIAIMSGADVLGDIRSQKLIGDATVGANTNALGTVTASILSSTNTAILATSALGAVGGYNQTIIPVDFAVSDTATNALSRTVGVWISASTTALLEFFDWEATFVPKMDITTKRATDWTDDGESGDKYLYGCLIEANTFGAARTVQIRGDGNILVATLTVNHAIQSTKPYAFSSPVITHQMRVIPTDANTWELFKIIWKWTKKPELTQFVQDWTDDGLPVPKYLQGFVLEGDTGGQNVSVALWGDGQLIQTFTVNHNGQLEKPYPVTTPPIVHEMRLIPSGNDIRYWDVFKIAWVYVKQPEFTSWVPDFTGKDPYSFRGVAIEADTHGATISVQVVTEDGLQRTLSVTHNGRQQKAYSFLEPFIATEIKLIPLGDWAQYPDWIVRWIADPRPDLAALYSDYTDDGYQSSKFMQGFSLSADTQGQDITFTIEFDGGQVGGVFTKVNHNGWMEIEYSFPTPFIAHLVRTIPSGPLRYLGPWSIRWIWEPAPDLAKNWITQTTSHGLRGFHHHRDCYTALQSYADVLLKVVMDDGNIFNYIIPSTGGEVRKPYEILQPMKGKLSQYNLISCKPFRLFKSDCEMRVKEWGSTGEFQIMRPYGGDHFRDGAKI